MSNNVRNLQGRGSHTLLAGTSKLIEIRNDQVSHFIITKLADLDIKIDFNTNESSSNVKVERQSLLALLAKSQMEVGKAVSNIIVGIGYTDVFGSESLTLEVFNTHATLSQTFLVTTCVISNNFREDKKFKYSVLKQNTINKVTEMYLDFTAVATPANVIVEFTVDGNKQYLTYNELLQGAIAHNDAIGEDDLDVLVLPFIYGTQVHNVTYEVKSEENPVFRYVQIEVNQKALFSSAERLAKREIKRAEIISQGSKQDLLLLKANNYLPKLKVM